jgi:asparagine synthase (glutamine-hydrolysing)
VIPGGVQLPPWIHPEALAQHELAHAAGAAVPASRLAGEARRRRHESIIATNHATSAEYLERLFARSGIRYADPWSDRRLADWVLAIPTQRITVDGTDKWVLREAMRGTVPDFARLATRASNPSTFYWYGVTEGAADAVRELLSEPRTAARGWVDAGELERAYARYQDGTWPGLLEWGAFWRWLSIEQWLRAHDL